MRNLSRSLAWRASGVLLARLRPTPAARSVPEREGGPMRRGVLATIWIAGLVFGALMPLAAAETGSSQRYLVVLAGQQTDSGFVADGAVSTAKGLVAAAGGTVANDLSGQIGVLVVE